MHEIPGAAVVPAGVATKAAPPDGGQSLILAAMDAGVARLGPDGCVQYVNDRLRALLRREPGLLEAVADDARRELVEFDRRTNGRPGPFARQAVPGFDEDRIPTPIPGLSIGLADDTRLLIGQTRLPDGSKILTLTDVTDIIRREVEEATRHLEAELRFRNEVMETHAASLATLAEAADESTRRVEAARQDLEREIGARRELEARLRNMATVDGLTGALNRAAFLSDGQIALDRARASGQGFALLMIDVDHFKAVNDRYGHPGGDQALRHLVATLRADIRRGDLLGRMGGEEFAIAMPEIAPADAEASAERLVMAVARSPANHAGRSLHLTVSIGLAFSGTATKTIECLLARADTALFRAKGGGRNRMVVDRRAGLAS